ncbi:hypothetical protein [Mucisphaera calidilacus]|uniref:Uncharacterized protein n=1 Tax=Mucisphaera calidilacus TaxID=2527982 RepID=A0A518BUY9_9BACT|nr:hypothetical protein [Mucisphaera calidilacus]QDU70767.1 hypothetical protein Pan265_06030 [Mucisphaera calidilacus]
MTTLIGHLRRTAQTLWRRGPGGSRWLYVAGLLLIASGLLHIPVWLIDGTPWTGSVSWRKPILFGISTGVTLLSLGWVVDLVSTTPRVWLSRAAKLVAFAGVAEVALITLQAWRGEPSHFNNTTPLNSAIHYAIDGLVSLIMLKVLLLTALSFTAIRPAHNRLTREDRLGVRFGMIALSLSCLFGFWMLLYGIPRAEAGQDPVTYGQAGVLKFVHGMPIHALQLLPITNWLMLRLGVKPPRRFMTTLCLALSTTLLTLYACVQTFQGLPRFDAGPVAGVVLLLGLALTLHPILTLAAQAWPGRR